MGASVGRVGVRRSPFRRLLVGRALLCLLAALAVCLPTQSAAAHPELDRAIRLSGELDFERALRAFDRAVESGTLTRDELVRLLAERALLLHALRRKDEVVQDFVWLAAIEPSYHLDARAPPDLTAVWDRVRSQEGGPTRLELVLDRQAGHARLRPVVHGPHPAGLSVTMYWRTGSAPYQQSVGTQPVEPDMQSGGVVQVYGELAGPGGVVFARVGTDQRALVLMLPEEDGVGSLVAGVPVDRPNRRKWIWIGSAAAVVVVGVVVAAVVATSGEDSKQTRLMPVASF